MLEGKQKDAWIKISWTIFQNKKELRKGQKLSMKDFNMLEVVNKKSATEICKEIRYAMKKAPNLQKKAVDEKTLKEMHKKYWEEKQHGKRS